MWKRAARRRVDRLAGRDGERAEELPVVVERQAVRRAVDHDHVRKRVGRDGRGDRDRVDAYRRAVSSRRARRRSRCVSVFAFSERPARSPWITGRSPLKASVASTLWREKRFVTARDPAADVGAADRDHELHVRAGARRCAPLPRPCSRRPTRRGAARARACCGRRRPRAAGEGGLDGRHGGSRREPADPDARDPDTGRESSAAAPGGGAVVVTAVVVAAVVVGAVVVPVVVVADVEVVMSAITVPENIPAQPSPSTKRDRLQQTLHGAVSVASAFRAIPGRPRRFRRRRAGRAGGRLPGRWPSSASTGTPVACATRTAGLEQSVWWSDEHRRRERPAAGAAREPASPAATRWRRPGSGAAGQRNRATPRRSRG